MITDTLTTYVTITRDPKKPETSYLLPIDLAATLYISGQLEKDKKGNYYTPGIDDPEIGLHLPTFASREIELATEQGVS